MLRKATGMPTVILPRVNESQQKTEVAASDPPAIKPLIVGAPFGNYIQPAGCTATLGTFTAARRGGLVNRAWRIMPTVRYYRRMRAWVNKIGLRNPGIDWLAAKVEQGKIDVMIATMSDRADRREIVGIPGLRYRLGWQISARAPDLNAG